MRPWQVFLGWTTITNLRQFQSCYPVTPWYIIPQLYQSAQLMTRPSQLFIIGTIFLTYGVECSEKSTRFAWLQRWAKIWIHPRWNYCKRFLESLSPYRRSWIKATTMRDFLDIGSCPPWISHQSKSLSEVGFHELLNNSPSVLEIEFLMFLEPQVFLYFTMYYLSSYRSQTKHYVLFGRATEKQLEGQWSHLKVENQLRDEDMEENHYRKSGRNCYVRHGCAK